MLGRLNPDYFLGGQIKLDHAAAEQALARLGERLGLDVSRAAQSVIDMANENMANAVRVLSIDRGLDPRRFALLAFCHRRQPLVAVSSHRLEQPVTVWLLGVQHHKTLVDERGEELPDMCALDVAVAAHGLRGGEIEAPGEHRQAREEQLLGRAQQIE